MTMTVDGGVTGVSIGIIPIIDDIPPLIQLMIFPKKEKHLKEMSSLNTPTLTCNGLCGGAPIPWWYMTSCFNWVDICECVWCFCMSTAARASARLRIPSFSPENMSPCKEEEKRKTRPEFRQVSVIHVLNSTV